MSRFLRASNSLFLHIPRTGGTWVKSVIAAGGIRSCQCNGKGPWSHCLIGHYEKEWFERFDFFFSFVRHPLSYYESAWKYCCEKTRSPLGPKALCRWKMHPFSKVCRVHEELKCENFDRWVEGVLEHEPCWYTRLIESFVGPEYREFHQFIGRTETIHQDLSDVLCHLGHKIDEDLVRDHPRKNVNSRKIIWNSDLKARVLFGERDMIKRFYGEKTTDKRWYERMEGVWG